ncbi:MAG: DegV family protein [Clostridia bacterium]|nr:DegV family protein [Clostridia bacterium]
MVRIFADSTCDLSPELIERYHIGIIPLHVILGDEDYLDGQNITPDGIYAWADEHKTTPKTAAVSMDDVMQALSPALDAGDEAVCFAISSSMSTTVNVFNLAVDELGAQDRVSVVDSQNLSTGGGLLVVEAAQMAEAGMNRSQIVGQVTALRPRVRASFVVDTLTYLHRGGRCSGLAALAGGALRLHPRISVREGKMQAEKKYRGRMNHVILAYAQDMESDLLAAKPEHVFITHSGCAQEDIDAVCAYIRGLGRFEQVHVTRAGGVISSHCGPGTLGVLFIAGE